MRPTPFQYHRAESLDHALALLAEFGEDGRPLGGGQSLVPMMNLRLARPAHLIDINALPLDTVEVAGSTLRLGALVRHRRYFDEPVIRDRFPAFYEAVQWIGHPTIRRHGTLGGSLSHADPTAELPAVSMLYDARIVAMSTQGERRIPASEFFKGAYTTALDPGEMIVAVEFPLPPERSAGNFVEIAERRGDFATVSVGVTIAASRGTISEAALVCAGAGLAPIRATKAEDALAGRPLDAPQAASIGRAFADSVDPVSDHVASADYRRSLIAELTRRTIDTACARAAALQ